MPSSHAAGPTCTHERRPGTTVCLHCRQEARLAAAERRQRWLLRGAATGLVAVVVIAGVWYALVGRNGLGSEAATSTETMPVDTVSFSSSRSSVVPQGGVAADSLAPAASTVQPGGSPAADSAKLPAAVTAPTPAPSPPMRATPPVAAIIQGTVDLGDGVTATRSDSAVTVAFDTPQLRTRMPEKFERFLRTTLPRIYGPAIAPALSAVPPGGLAGQGSLLADLPTRGMHVPVGQGWTLDIFPETRAGQDGPLVVRYRSHIRKD